MSSPASSLPDAWVQRIWSTMRATYGAALDRMWATPPGADPAQHAQQLMAHWAKALGRYQSNPQAISHALDHLPPHPPNLVEFQALCNRRPDVPDLAALSGPKADPARVQQVLEGLDRRPAGRDPQQTLRELAASDAKDGTYRGKPVTLAQRKTYRQALGMDQQGATR